MELPWTLAPKAKATTIGFRVPPSSGGVNPEWVWVIRCGHYAPSALASATEAATARVFAHSLNPWISSARVVESGTVAFNASSSACVVSGCLLVYAA